MLPKELGFDSGVTCWRRLRDRQKAGAWSRLHPPRLEQPNAQPFSFRIPTSWCGVLEGLREDGVEVELLDQGPAVPHLDLPENVL
jgi:hypothetical protein